MLSLNTDTAERDTGGRRALPWEGRGQQWGLSCVGACVRTQMHMNRHTRAEVYL